MYDFEGNEIRYVADQSSDQLRSNTSHANDVKVALENKKAINGVEGDLILNKLPHFDMAWSFYYDIHAWGTSWCMSSSL